MDSYILVFPNGYCLSTCAIRDPLWVNGSDEAINVFSGCFIEMRRFTACESRETCVYCEQYLYGCRRLYLSLYTISPQSDYNHLPLIHLLLHSITHHHPPWSLLENSLKSPRSPKQTPGPNLSLRSYYAWLQIQSGHATTVVKP